jgi:uncharacterized membrane protein YfcA
MLRDLKIRSYVLVIQGVLILGLGVVFLYLRANMREEVFDVVDVGIAIMLTVAALIIAALADWIAALGEGVEHFRRFAFYLLCGFGLLMACAFLVYSHYRTLALMLSFAGVHALVYAMSVFSFQLSHLHRAHHRSLLFASGGVSLLFAIAMIFFATSNDDELATLLIGAYLCFAGARMLHQSWRLHEVYRHLAEHKEGHPVAEN